MRRRYLRKYLVVVTSVLLGSGLIACGGDDAGGGESEHCGMEGSTVQCFCTDGRTGAQECQEDGSLGECVCTGGDAGSGGEGGVEGAAGTGGSGGGSSGEGGGEAGVGGEGGAAGAAGGAGEGGVGGEGGEGGVGGAGAGGQGGGAGTPEPPGELHDRCDTDEECAGELVCFDIAAEYNADSSSGFCTEECRYNPMFPVSDCPDAGNTNGRCHSSSRCYLDCSSSWGQPADCPDGMACERVGSPMMSINFCNYQ